MYFPAYYRHQSSLFVHEWCWQHWLRKWHPLSESVVSDVSISFDVYHMDVSLCVCARVCLWWISDRFEGGSVRQYNKYNWSMLWVLPTRASQIRILMVFSTLLLISILSHKHTKSMLGWRSTLYLLFNLPISLCTVDCSFRNHHKSVAPDSNQAQSDYKSHTPGSTYDFGCCWDGICNLHCNKVARTV